MSERIGRYSTRQRYIAVDEELNQVVQFVGQGIDRAGQRLRCGVGKCQRRACLVAGWEGDVLEAAMVVFDVFSGLKRTIQAADGHEIPLGVPFAIGLVRECGLLCGADRGAER